MAAAASRRAAAEPGRDRDPLVEPERTAAAAARVRPAGRRRPPARRGDRAQDEVVGDGAGVEARRRGGDVRARRSARPRGSAGPPGRAGPSREWSSWKPSRRRPEHGERQVELRRREPDDRRERGQRVAHAACASPGLARQPAERLGEREPLLDRERLRPPVAVRSRRRRARRRSVGASHRELARQHVVEHLAPLAEAGLDEPPQLSSSSAASSRSSAAYGSTTSTADSTSGAGSNAAGGHAGTRRAPGRGTGRTPTGSSCRPGGAAIRSATSRWTISTKRSGRGALAEQRGGGSGS